MVIANQIGHENDPDLYLDEIIVEAAKKWLSENKDRGIKNKFSNT